MKKKKIPLNQAPVYTERNKTNRPKINERQHYVHIVTVYRADWTESLLTRIISCVVCSMSPLYRSPATLKGDRAVQLTACCVLSQ